MYKSVLFLILAIVLIQEFSCSGIVIKIPDNLRNSNYRLAYEPQVGNPPSNSPINNTNVIKFTDALPGTRYFFWIYSANNVSEINNSHVWTVNASTEPDPPKNLRVNVTDTKSVLVSWDRPDVGSYSNFTLKLSNITYGRDFLTHEVTTDQLSYQFSDLSPGASYQLKIFSVFEDRECPVYISQKFTTMPNIPGKFIVWFRNETTLLVLWQPPYPAGIFSEYVVSITPNDTEISVISVKKENDPPGPAQAAFKDLVPGRAYEISVQTVSEDQFSLPTKAVYRTLPLRPFNLTIDYNSITSFSFKLHWSAPKEYSEFDKYSVSLNTGRKQFSITKNRNEDTSYEFKEHLEPGMSYQVSIKTVSGKVSSYSVNGNLTLPPLPVQNLVVKFVNGSFALFWTVANNSYQNSFKISYHETESLNEDSSTLMTNETSIGLSYLLPGRNYSISVRAISNTTESPEVTRFLLTKPSTPVIGDLRPLSNGLDISWKSDVNSKQDFFHIQWTRNDTGQRFNDTTADFQYHISNLYPGAGYIVKLYAISHNLSSDPQEYFQPIFPKPPEHVRLIRLSESTVILRWDDPIDTLFTDYSCRLKTSSSDWSDPKKVTENSFEINDLYPGELYIIQINTVSYGLESISPQQINYTIRPDFVRNISSYPSSNNITLKWKKPKGIVQTYLIRWTNIEAENEQIEYDSKDFVPTASDNSDVVLIDNLRSGYLYFFNITTTSNNLEGNTTQLQVRTLPLIESDLIIFTDTNSVTVRYTETPRSSSKFDFYRFSISIPDEKFIERMFDDKNRTIIFENLTPGNLYYIVAWTVSQNVTSRPLVKKARLYPEQIKFINASFISDKEIHLSWDNPSGKYDDFLVKYLKNENQVESESTNTTNIELKNLQPYKNYTFAVIVRSGVNSTYMLLSQPISATYQTSESVPDRIDVFRPIDVQPTSIHFQWNLKPESQNGILLKYTIAYSLEESFEKKYLHFNSNEQEGSIKDLLPGHVYVFEIQAETRIGYGPVSEFKQKMPILAPPKPAAQVVPTEVFRSKNTIQVRFRKNYFSDDNGNVTAYTIIVAEDTSKNTSGLEMPSWYDVQAYSKWPPYQVLEPYYPFTNSSIEDLTIGTENCDFYQTAGYCNGPLKPGTTYKIKVRAFSAPDKFTDTSYSFPMQTDADNTSILMSIFFTLLFTIILCAFFIFLIRYKRLYERSFIGKAVDNFSMPESIIETRRPVLIKDFANHYRVLSADSDFRFSEEFEDLKVVGRDQKCTFADLPCNRPKNRFTNILPYDHSRYKLQPVDDEEGSDYINANYVPGYNSPREFIVTQGPLHSTHDDFWRMCWESNSRAIVMLTRCIEKGREKCDHYWPYDTLPVYYGDISVQILNDSHYNDWSITEFLVCRGNEQRVIRHFHFTTWPDFGVPSPPQILIKFVRSFRERVDVDQMPIVVHCSAGVGRSGTFIALDRLLQLIKESDTVDIFGIVYQMRKERVWMVQTEQQYICIHKCLLAVLEGKENSYLMMHHDNDLLNQSYDDDIGGGVVSCGGGGGTGGGGSGGGGVDKNNDISTHDLSCEKEEILIIDRSQDDEKDSAIIEYDDIDDELLLGSDKDNKR